MPFDHTPLSPLSTSVASIADYEAYQSTRGGKAQPYYALDTNGDWSATLSGETRILASNRALVHGGADGEWRYQTHDALWELSTDSTAALAAGRTEAIKLFLNWASRLIDPLPELCGTPSYARTKTYAGELTASVAGTFSSPAVNNAFKWIAEAEYPQFSVSGLGAASGDYQSLSLDTSADPHVLTVSGMVAADATATNAQLSFTYEAGLTLPRSGIKVPRAIRYATCALARALMSEKAMFADKLDAAGLVKRAEVFEAVKVEFAVDAKTLSSQDKSYLSDEVLALLESYLCKPIRGFGQDKESGFTVTGMGSVYADEILPYPLGSPFYD